MVIDALVAPFQVLVRQRPVITTFVQREIRTRYGTSALGLGWPLIRPLTLLALYTFVFSYVMKVRFDDNAHPADFALKLFCGLVPWMAFADGVSRATGAITDQASLVKRIRFPSEILPIHQVLVALAIESLGLIILLGWLIVIGRAPGWPLLTLALIVIPQFLFTTGVAMDPLVALGRAAGYAPGRRLRADVLDVRHPDLLSAEDGARAPAVAVLAQSDGVCRRCLPRRDARVPGAGAGGVRGLLRRLRGGVHRRILGVSPVEARVRGRALMSEPVIELDAVTKSYKIYRNPRHRAVELLVPGAPVLHTPFLALRDVSLRVERGETLGVVGANGSGKSTMLQIIAGIVRQTSGRVSVRGRVSSLLELGAGFHPELTGRENVEVFGTIIGLTLAEIRQRLPDIERFAGIGDFIDQPVKLYSSGMFVRLAFSAAIHVDPDVLLVDEALAVGDAVFQHQCLLRIREMQSRGTTIIVVSHDMGMIKAISSWVVLLDGGQVIAQGGPAEMASLYFARASAEIAKAEAPHLPAMTVEEGADPRFQTDATLDARVRVFRHGTGAARIRRVELLDARRAVPRLRWSSTRKRCSACTPSTSRTYRASIIGFGFRDRTGTELDRDQHTRRRSHAAVSRCRLDPCRGLPSPPSARSRNLQRQQRDRGGSLYSRAYFDWVDNALVMTVSPPSSGKAIHGQVWVPVDISVHPS